MRGFGSGKYFLVGRVVEIEGEWDNLGEIKKEKEKRKSNILMK